MSLTFSLPITVSRIKMKMLHFLRKKITLKNNFEVLILFKAHKNLLFKVLTSIIYSQ